MTKRHRAGSHYPKPGVLKRLRQWEAMLRPRREPLLFPQPEPPQWKPLG